MYVCMYVCMCECILIDGWMYKLMDLLILLCLIHCLILIHFYSNVYSIITRFCVILNIGIVPSMDSKSQDIREIFLKFLRDFISRSAVMHKLLDKMIGIFVRSW